MKKFTFCSKILQPCTKLRAKREAFEIAIANLSVRHTDTDKSASLLSVSFVALRYASTFTSFRQTTSVFWTFLKGFFGRPSKICNIALAITLSKSKKADKMPVFLMLNFFIIRFFDFCDCSSNTSFDFLIKLLKGIICISIFVIIFKLRFYPIP